MSRCTCFDLSFVFAWPARFHTLVRMGSKRHILCFVACSSRSSFIMKSADDDWEELRPGTFCDASFGTRCFERYKVKLTGSRGSSFLWASRLQGPQSTSSTESESIEWGRAAKRQRSALGSAKRLISEARAFQCPCRKVFPFAGAASNSAASSGHDRKRGKHHDKGFLDSASPRALQNRF